MRLVPCAFVQKNVNLMHLPLVNPAEHKRIPCHCDEPEAALT